VRANKAKGSVKTRRKTAGWSPDFLLEILQLKRALTWIPCRDKGTLNPEPLPPLAKPDNPRTPARELFARKTTPTALPARSIGFYTKGCLAGGVALPINGENWQVMPFRATVTGDIRLWCNS
jgi:Penicillin-insensitive murein endopeptidase